MFNIFASHIALFGALPGFDLVELIKWTGVIGIALIAFAESGLLIGVFLPGDTLLFTAGFLVHTNILSVNIHALVGILFVAAVLGDNIGYTFGRRIGRKLFERPDSRFFKQSYVQKAEGFYGRQGGKAIVLARFIPFVRTFAPVIAGTAKMNYRTFFIYNVIGAALWTTSITYLGFFLGAWFDSMGLNIDQVILPTIAIIIFISIAPPLYHLLKEREQREALWKATKIELAKIFQKKGR